MAVAAPKSRAIGPLQTGHYAVTFATGSPAQGINYSGSTAKLLQGADRVQLVASDHEPPQLQIVKAGEDVGLHSHHKKQSTAFLVELGDDEKTVVLRPLENDYDFDIPLESHGSPTGSDDGHFGLGKPDPDNPYDFRHYLRGFGDQEVPSSNTASRIGTPMHISSPFLGSPRGFLSDFETRPIVTKPQPANPVKAGKSANPVRRNAKAPKVQMQRRATTKTQVDPPAETHYDGLIIEDGSQPATKRQRISTPIGGPISLQRATNTLQGMRDDLPTPSLHHGWTEPALSEDDEVDEDGERVDSDENSDADVEEFELGAPATSRRQSEWADDELEDLVAQFDEPSEEPFPEIATPEEIEQQPEIESEEE